MKGSVLRVFAKMVEQNFGNEMFDDLVEDCQLPSGGAYTSVGYYNDRELFDLVAALSLRTQTPVPAVLHAFGEFWVLVFLEKYALANEAYASLFDFLDDIETHWRAETLSLYPSDQHPTFEVRRVDDQTTTVLFRAVPPLSQAAPGILGILEGAVAYYGVDARVEMEDKDLDETSAVRFQISLIKSPSQNQRDIVARLTKRLERETRAREEAELLLDAKSLELYEVNESLKAANQRLEGAVSQRTAQLEAALTEAKRANDVKSQFLANVSHELRTPLNGVLGMIDLARAGAVDTEQRGFLDYATRSADMLAALLGDLLNVSKIEAGLLEMRPTAFDLASVGADLKQIFSATASNQGLELVITVNNQVAGKQILADQLRIHQILWNLISNALKFTDSGAIRVDLQTKLGTDGQGQFIGSVIDTGVGIQSKDQAEVFERFVQLGQGYRKNTGSGLGLAISKGLVDQMGGQITLSSVVGEGSHFRFSLPIQLIDPSSTPPADVLKNAIKIPLSASPKDGTVAIIDDSMANVVLAKASLEKAGFAVVTASNGEEGLALLDSEPSDLVLLDLSMPDIDGFEVLRRFRAKAVGPNVGTKVVALTAHVLPETKTKVRDHGFDGFLGKPLRPTQLIASVHDFLTED